MAPDDSQDVVEPETWQLLEFLATRVRMVKKQVGFLTDLGEGLVMLDDGDVPDDWDRAATSIYVDRISGSISSRAQTSSDVGVVIEFAVPRSSDEHHPHRLVHRARKDLIRVLKLDERQLPLGFTKFEVLESQLAEVTDDTGHTSVVAQITARAGLTETFQPLTTL